MKIKLSSVNFKLFFISKFFFGCILVEISPRDVISIVFIQKYYHQRKLFNEMMPK